VRTGGAEPFALQADWIVNCAGLGAQQAARSMAGLPASAIPRRHLAKGHYFALAGASPFSRLIYPVPVDGGLGVHLTLDLAGQARFGPDVQWLDLQEAAEPDFTVDASRAQPFADEIRRYWPALLDGALSPSYAGVRPKIAGPGSTADFRIDGPAQHGAPGIVNLFGIESPGLTACLALAEHVCRTVEENAPGR
jgi:L-2-hydroxyglutarate oxidase LhgO